MKTGFFVKIAIGILIVFGLLLAVLFFHKPFYFKYYEWSFASDDPLGCEATAENVAGWGTRAIPFIQNWLENGNEKVFCGACLSLEKMEGEKWKYILPELKKILCRAPSKRTDAAASLIFKKGYACEKTYWPNYIKWKNFNENNRIKFNICTYILRHEQDKDWRASIVRYMGKLGDPRTVGLFIRILDNESDSGVRWKIVYELGRIRDQRAAGILIKLLENDLEFNVRTHAATALGIIGDARALEALINALEEDMNAVVRGRAAAALSLLGDKRAIVPLISAYECDVSAREYIITALGVLPPEFPHPLSINVKNLLTEQTKKMVEWFEKNKHKLEWDKKTRRYHLR